MSTHAVTLADILAAKKRIAGKVERTGCAVSPGLSERFGAEIFLKMEHRQTTGSFKLRGASNAIAALSEEERARGVVACSTGNHGRGLAFAAKREGVRATICMSSLVPENKLAEIRSLGADVRIIGNSQDEAQGEVERLVAEEGRVMLPPFDHAHVIAGQGTLGLEIMEDVPEAKTVIVPVSGGGLAAGIAVAVRTVNPAARVVGVSMARGAAMKASLDAGKPVQVEEMPSLADSLGGGIGLDNAHTFALCRDLLDGVVLLSEAEIAAGVRHAYAEEREVLEGSGAVAIAALLAEKARAEGPTVLVLTGRNIDMTLHRQIVNGETTRFEEMDALARADGSGETGS